MDEQAERPAAPEAAAPVEALLPVKTLVSHFREVVPLLLGGSEGELFSTLSKDDSGKALAKQVSGFQRSSFRQIHRR